jgi:hypothetical protein
LNSSEISTIEQFERVVVFKSARMVPLILSVIATLLLVIAVIVLMYSIFPSLKPAEPAPVAEPAQVSVSNSEITDYLNRTNQPVPAPANQGEAANASPSAPAAPTVSPEAQSLAKELDAIRKQAVALSLPWGNEYKTVCQAVFFNNCYGARTVLAVRGVSGYIEQSFSHHDQDSSTAEAVQIGDQNYRINPSQYPAKLAILKELEGVLAAAHPDDARKLLNTWGKLREEKEKDRDAAFNAEVERRADEYTKAQFRYQTTVERKHVLRRASLAAAGMALFGFVLLGLILAVLAVERHTRLLEAQLESSKPMSGASIPAMRS